MNRSRPPSNRSPDRRERDHRIPPQAWTRVPGPHQHRRQSLTRELHSQAPRPGYQPHHRQRPPGSRDRCGAQTPYADPNRNRYADQERCAKPPLPGDHRPTPLLRSRSRVADHDHRIPGHDRRQHHRGAPKPEDAPARPGSGPIREGPRHALQTRPQRDGETRNHWDAQYRRRRSHCPQDDRNGNGPNPSPDPQSRYPSRPLRPSKPTHRDRPAQARPNALSPHAQPDEPTRKSDKGHPDGWPLSKECPAASYSPTRSPLQYHRR